MIKTARLLYGKIKKSTGRDGSHLTHPNYLDDDYPSDILSRDAHVKFINKVQNKELDYPELWLWHLRGNGSWESRLSFLR